MLSSFSLVTLGILPDLTLAPAFGFAQINNKGSKSSCRLFSQLSFRKDEHYIFAKHTNLVSIEFNNSRKKYSRNDQLAQTWLEKQGGVFKSKEFFTEKDKMYILLQ